MKYKVVVDIYPNIIKGTNGCHKYIFGEYSSMKKAIKITDEINSINSAGFATIEKI